MRREIACTACDNESAGFTIKDPGCRLAIGEDRRNSYGADFAVDVEGAVDGPAAAKTAIAKSARPRPGYNGSSTRYPSEIAIKLEALALVIKVVAPGSGV